MRSITISGSIKVNNALGVVGLSPVAVPSIFVVDKRLPHLLTAATRSGRCSRHRRRSHHSPPSICNFLSIKKDLPFGRSFFRAMRYESHFLIAFF